MRIFLVRETEVSDFFRKILRSSPKAFGEENCSFSMIILTHPVNCRREVLRSHSKLVLFSVLVSTVRSRYLHRRLLLVSKYLYVFIFQLQKRLSVVHYLRIINQFVGVESNLLT